MSFIGFEQFASTPQAAQASNGLTQTEPIYSGGDAELAITFKKIVKRDPTTKLKGLEELREYGESKSVAAMRGAAPHYVHCYLKVVYDRDRRVREALHRSLEAFVPVVPKAFANRLPALLGAVWAAMSDPAAEVAAAATAAFGTLAAASGPSSDALLRSAVGDVCRYLDVALGYNAATLIESRLCLVEDADEAYVRVVASALGSLKRLVIQLKATPTAVAELLEARAWTMFENQYPSIRREAYELLSAVCVHATSVFMDLEGPGSSAGARIFGALDDAHKPNAQPLWNSVLRYLNACPMAWSRTDKTALPKVFKLLREGRVPDACLLPLVASMPADFTESYKKGGAGPPSARIYRDLFECAWQGLGPARADEAKHAACVAALSETTLYVLLRPRLEAEAVVATSELAAVALDYFMRAVGTFLSHEAGASWAEKVVADLSVAISKLSSAAQDRPSVAVHCAEPPEEVLWRTFHQALLGSSATDLGFERLAALLVAVLESGSEVPRRRVRGLMQLLQKEVLACCPSPDSGRVVIRALRFIAQLAPMAGDGALFEPEYNGEGNELVVAALDQLSSPGNDVEVALQYARCAIDEAYLAGGATGLGLWRKVVERCAPDLRLLEGALRVSTPEPSLVYTRHGVLTSDNALDATVVSLFTGEPSLSSEGLLRLCLASSMQTCPWPLISESALGVLISSCCDAAEVGSSKVWRLSLLLDCALSSCPYVEEVFRAAAPSLLQQLFRCRGTSRFAVLGADLWSKHANQLLRWSAGGSGLATLEAETLRAQLEGFFEERETSSADVVVQHWADQVNTLALLESDRAGFVFEKAGLLDVTLWDRLTKDTPHVWSCLNALLEKVDRGHFLASLAAAAGSTPRLLWAIVVGASAQVVSATSSRQQEKFSEDLLKQWLPPLIDRIVHPSNVLGIQAVVDAAGGGKGLILDALCFGAQSVCRDAADSSSATFLLNAQALAGLVFALKPPREASLPLLKVGDHVYYDTQQSDAGFAVATIVSIVQDEEQFFTIDCGGRERETVAERLRIELPEPVERTALDTLTSLIKHCDQALRDRVPAAYSTFPPAGTDGLVLCIGTLSTFLGPNSGLVLSKTCSHWQSLLMTSQDKMVQSLALDVLAVTVESNTLLNGESTRKWLVERALAVSSAHATDQPSKLVRFLAAVVVTHGWAPGLPLTSTLLSAMDASTPSAQLSSVSLVRALIPLVGGAEAGLLARQLVPIFLDSAERTSSDTGLFSSLVEKKVLAECVEELCMIDGASDIGAFELSASEIERLHRKMTLGGSADRSMGVQLSAFAVLQVAGKSIPVQPRPGGGAAADEGSIEEEEPSVLARRMMSPHLREALASTPESHQLDDCNDNDDAVGELLPRALLLLLLPWCLFLDRVEVLCRGEPDGAPLVSAWAKTLAALPRLLAACAAAYDELTDRAARSLVASGRPLLALDAAARKPLAQLLGDAGLLREFACRVLARTVLAFPGLVRHWWSNDCPRSAQPAMQRFVEKEMALIIARREVAALRSQAGDASGAGGLTVTGSALTREITAVYVKEECNLEVAIRLPPAYPLRNVEVDCRKRLGVAEPRWRRWVLQIVTLLSTQDACVQQAVDLWKKNVDREFEGLEPCPICYSILHPKNLALPSLECGTCKNKFHPECLYKWFNTSHKSKCPMCQQPFNI